MYKTFNINSKRNFQEDAIDSGVFKTVMKDEKINNSFKEFEEKLIEKSTIEINKEYNYEKIHLESKINQLISDNEILVKENNFLQKKLSEIKIVQEKQEQHMKEEYIELVKKNEEFERFIELFIFFVKKIDLDSYKHSFTKEGYTILEEKLLQLESYINDLKKENSLQKQSYNNENERNLKYITELKTQNKEYKKTISTFENQNKVFINIEEHQGTVERMDKIIKSLNEENKMLKEKIQSLEMKIESQLKERRSVRVNEENENKFSIKTVETKIVQSFRKEENDKKATKLTPYNIQRNIRKLEDMPKIVMGKEIIIENNINQKSQESPKFYVDTNKDRTPTFNNEDDFKVNKKKKEEKKEENYKDLEKRLEEIEKDISYFKKSITNDFNKDLEGFSNNTINHSYDNSKSLKLSIKSSNSKNSKSNKNMTDINFLKGSTERNKRNKSSNNLFNNYYKSTDNQKGKLMNVYLKNLNVIERELNFISKKKY